MTSGQRAFAQKLSRQQAADVRKQVSSAYVKQISKSGSDATISVPLSDAVEPLDYENFIIQHEQEIDADLLHHLLEFPSDDIEVGVIPRKIRTIVPVVPDEPFDTAPHVRDCVQCYTADWLGVCRRYQCYSSSYNIQDRAAEKANIIKSTEKQVYEIDLENDADSTGQSSKRSSVNDTPRGSWASSMFDLQNSLADPLLPDLLDKESVDTADHTNETVRSNDRQQDLFKLYPLQDEDEIVERRLPADIPSDRFGYRILVRCLTLKLDFEIEPIFACMALYDVRDKKKISENFYFDMNPDHIKKMMARHVPYQDVSTLSRACIFNITYPSPDIFLLIKLEKVLQQGDITECAEPYMKDDKNREKAKQNAQYYCEKLGQYMMPFAWTAIYLMNIIKGVGSADRDSTASDFDSIGSASSLERKALPNYDSFKRNKSETFNSLPRRGSVERTRSLGFEKRYSWSPEDTCSNLENFRPVTLTVSSFFKQETDRLSDDDLYKFLLDLKRPTSGLKKLKCIPGTLKLDISPSPDDIKYCLTPELAKIDPYPDDKGRPTKEIIEFPPREVFVPHYQYRNILFVYPKSINFANRTGSARNIAVKIQLLAAEEDHNALPVIFGKSSCPEFKHYAYTAVNYHNKTPDFYEEVKIKLPCQLDSQHHLLFTFYHISCQKKIEQTPLETEIGCTWLPLCPGRRLQVGEFCLPVSLEKLPPGYSVLHPEVQLPGMKWLDNHKPVFTVKVEAVSSIHTLDPAVDHFLFLCYDIEEENLPGRVSEVSVESELKQCITNLNDCALESLVHFLPLVLDKLILLLVHPPVIAGQMINVGQTSFETLAEVIKTLTIDLEMCNDQHGRNSLLASYIQFACTLPQQDTSHSLSAQCTPTEALINLCQSPLSSSYPRSSSNPELTGFFHHVSSPVEAARPIERTGSMRTTYESVNSSSKLQCKKLVHEEIALQWVVSSGSVREAALANAWFFFELMVKSMAKFLAETDKLDAPRQLRFSSQFVDDITALLSACIADIINRHNKEWKLVQSLNNSVAFFLYDALSLMDRGYVFGQIRYYCHEIAKKISTLNDSSGLMCLKLDFLRIICSHEHYITLNLPFGTHVCPSRSSSPSPSVVSSQSGLSSLCSNRQSVTFSDLPIEFRQQHYLVGLVLSNLSVALESSSIVVHHKAVNLVRNLLACHDSDPRYSDRESRCRIAALYQPLLGIVMGSLCQLVDSSSGKPVKSVLAGDTDEYSSYQSHINQSVAMAIAGSSVFSRESTSSGVAYGPMLKQKPQLKVEDSCTLLMCFLWVLKNIEKRMLVDWWTTLSLTSMQELLDVLYFCVSCFEYKGISLIKRQSQQVFQKSSDIKSKLEDVILGAGSARSEMMLRRRERNPPSPHMSGERSLRWRKEMTQWKQAFEQPDRPKVHTGYDAHIEGNLATEVNLLVVDMLEFVIKMIQQSESLQSSNLLGGVLRVFQHCLTCNQSELVLKNLFASQRSLVFKFPELLFEEETEQCADLCLRLLTHCSSCLSSVRSQASGSLYLLMRQNFEIGNNFARVKMQVTMSLSSLVGTNQSFNEEYLRRSLKTMLIYAEEDVELQETTFPEQVKDLVFNLHMILSDTVKMKEFQEDPEMLIDLMYRIAKGYQTSPDLRLTWLQNMAGKHSERNNHAEAAMCIVHSAALVAEYLHMIEDRRYLPIGCVTFQHISPNVLEESAVSDDVVSPDEEGICTGKYFSENGLVGLLEQSASSFNMASMYEAVNEVYHILIPIHEANKDYKKLASVHGKLHDAFNKVAHQPMKRIFSSFYRVGFYSSKFGDLDGEEFVYKEQPMTKLPEISHRLESFYIDRFGPNTVEIIKDSNNVDRSKLNPDKAYIQITYVEPYFDMYELRDRTTDFDKNFTINRFVYATPFTHSGRAHGELREQYKRKTILTTTHSFPYIRTRIQVKSRKQVVLTPIEVAIEDIQKKTAELYDALSQEPPDPKILQMVLQGCIGTTVNQGPMEIALVFLSDVSDGTKPCTKHQNKLRLCFKDFIRKCADALRKNKTLISQEQREYQKELERNYSSLVEKLGHMLISAQRRAQLEKGDSNNETHFTNVTTA